MILDALITVGYDDEAADFMDWLRRYVEHTPQIMYTIDGQHIQGESTLDKLDGYRGSRPVRTGNAAWRTPKRCVAPAS